MILKISQTEFFEIILVLPPNLKDGLSKDKMVVNKL